MITHTLDLQPLIDADAGFASDDYPPALLASYREGTALHGLPYAVQFSTLNYNQTAFDLAELDYPTIDWTMGDFLHAAQQLTVRTGPTRQYGYAAPVLHTRDIQFFLDRAGAALVQQQDDTFQPTLTDPTVVAAMHDYLDLLRNFSPHTEIYGYRHDHTNSLDATNLIFAGQVGMWLATDMSSSIGQIPGVAMATAPIPLGDSRLTPNDFQVRGLHITATTPHPQACWSWITHLSGEVALMQGNVFPARRSVATSEAFRTQAAAGTQEVFQAYIVALDQGTAPAAAPDIARMDYYWFYQAIDRTLPGADLEAALEEAQATTTDFLACIRTGAAGHLCASQVDPDYKGIKHQPPDAD
jgi:ABC-type glycerol-3-phosphate transport system substrate-binding protein